MTYTYAFLEVDTGTYADVRARLTDARYGHALLPGVIDMHGIALEREQPPWRKGECPQCGALIYLDHAHICNTERSNRETLFGD